MANIAKPQVKFDEPEYLRELTVLYLPISDLVPLKRRSRLHGRKQVEQIANAIRAFDFTNPILIDDKNRVIAGFGRVLAAKRLGMTSVPAIRLSGMSEAQLRAYAIADNKIAENADWDTEILALEFEYLSELDIDLDLTVTGFVTPEIDLIIGEAALEEPEPPVPPVQSNSITTRPGDLWCLGPHRLYCGDAREASSYEALLGTSRAQAVITDPPYNIRIANLVGKGRTRHREFAMASGEMSEDQFVAFLRATLSHGVAFSAPGALSYVFMDWRHLHHLNVVGLELFDEQKALIVWDKGRGGMGSLYRSQHELIAVYKNGSGPHINNVELGKFGRNRTNIWRYPPARPGGEADLNLHPTSKPISMIADAIQDCTHRGGFILDPFGGSGTTLLAAERTGRRGALLELDSGYVDVIVRRWQGMTGDEAKHAESGLSFDELSHRHHADFPVRAGDHDE